MDRRRFIERLVRGGLLTSMAVLAGVFLSRRQVSLRQECGLETQCRSCAKLKGCRLPEAEKERGYEKG